KPARVPWFGYQLFSGNSLIGARREVHKADAVRPRANPKWHEGAPRRLNPQAQGTRLDRANDEIYHFLLPDPGMAAYTNRVAKALYPEDFAHIRQWSRDITDPLQEHEIARLLQLSDAIDALWEEHTKQLAQDRARTEDPLAVWPHTEAIGTRTTR